MAGYQFGHFYYCPSLWPGIYSKLKSAGFRKSDFGNFERFFKTGIDFVDVTFNLFYPGIFYFCDKRIHSLHGGWPGSGISGPELLERPSGGPVDQYPVRSDKLSD